MKILLTNDDGIKSGGFYPLLKELSNDFNVITIIPHEDNSWIGKRLNPNKKIEIINEKLEEFNIFTSTGSPADCVQLGLHNFDTNFDMVVAGINIGENIGTFTFSSGTVGAAIEAALSGKKAIAFSMHIPEGFRDKNFLRSKEAYPFFENAAKIAKKIVHLFINEKFDKSYNLINVNIHPNSTIDSEISVTKPLLVPYNQLFFKEENFFKMIWKDIYPDYYKGKINVNEDTDIGALVKQKISITPISLNLTNDEAIEKVKNILKEKL
jgi:5'-nucleotidase